MYEPKNLLELVLSLLSVSVLFGHRLSFRQSELKQRRVAAAVDAKALRHDQEQSVGVAKAPELFAHVHIIYCCSGVKLSDKKVGAL